MYRIIVVLIVLFLSAVPAWADNDAKPYGNTDGRVGYDDLGRYFKETLTYYARRYYGREQTTQIVNGGQL